MKSEHMPEAGRLKELLMGRKVVATRMTDEETNEGYMHGPTGYLTLDDGTELKVWGNDGGCACSAGCYPLTELNTVDNIITNVEVEERPIGDGYDPCYVCGETWCGEHDGWYRIFVFADNEKINLASFEGSDGNGYYGTGWWLAVMNSGQAAGELA